MYKKARDYFLGGKLVLWSTFTFCMVSLFLIFLMVGLDSYRIYKNWASQPSYHISYDGTTRHTNAYYEAADHKESAIVYLLCSLIPFPLAVFGIFKIQKSKGSIEADIAYDELAASMIRFPKDAALYKLGLDESEVTEAAPVCISGYSFDGAEFVKKGKDGKWRSNRYETWYLFFSKNEVHCCKKTIKTTEDWKTESTDVYFYKDIVSVSTTSESKKTILRKQIDYDCFVLTTAGGTAFKVSLKDVDYAQRSINAMRSLLRAKKQEG